ncbi:PAS domain-containing protein [Candidatus Poribacteria bacterium]|nr:PAS domain-containing protein [Candidatus Poribacteria bacterium]
MNLLGGLRARVIGLTVAIVVVFMSTCFLVLLHMNRAHTLSRFEELTARMSELIAVGLENDMLDRDLNLVNKMAVGLSEHDSVEAINILNKKGEVKISSEKAMLGRYLDTRSDGCRICHEVPPESRRRSAIVAVNGRRVFRSVLPIANKPACHSCHSPAEKVNGMLIADFSMELFDREMRAGLLSMIAAIAVTISGLTGFIWMLMASQIIRRLDRFLEGVRLLSTGDLSGQIAVEGRDEISDLERAFNSMASNLQASMAEVKFARDSLANLINSITDEIIVIDRDFRIVTANHAALSRLGKRQEEILGRFCHDVCYNLPEPCSDPERDCPVRATFSSGVSYSTSRAVAVNGENRYLEQYVSPVRNETGEIIQVVKISRDVTRRRKLEEQLVQSERLISLGQLAAGVAHQVNNPIGIIVNRIDCLKRESKTAQLPESFQADLDVMVNCAWRVSEIIRNLLTFSRETPLIVESVDVNRAIKTSLDLIQMQAVNHEITFEALLGDGLPFVRGDVNKLEQCFVNIINNAVDAIPSRGRVTVESSLCDEGRAVSVRISDTGVGIAPEHMEKIFDPFFTTKGVGKGTGLGLSISYGIVKDHGGRLDVESVPGEGTTFTITLPIRKEVEHR